jgi:tetratricopeptide (TPR) repeat protein
MRQRTFALGLAGMGIVMTSLMGFGEARGDDSFRAGMESYQTGQFVDAANAFRASLSNAPAAGTLVNLGMTEWRRGRTGAAILAWEQALWVDSFNQPARNNLQFARESTGLDAPRLEWYETASTWLPTNSWAWIAVLGMWLALGMITLPTVFRWRRTSWHQALAALGLGIFLLSLPAHFGVMTRSHIGFVLERKTPLRLTPTAEADDVATLVAGEPVRQLRVQGDYAFVSTRSGSGWIERDKLGLLCPL